jgi:hypothetical protein
MKRGLLVLGVLVGVPAACLGALKLETIRSRASDFEPIDQQRAELVKQAARLRAVAKAVAQQAPLEADSEVLALNGGDFRRYPPEGVKATGALVEDTQLTDDGLHRDFGYSNPWIALESSPFWSRCIAWVETGKSPDGNPPQFRNVIEEELAKFLAVKVVGVARTVELVLPESAGDSKFSAGRWRFDLFFYTLEDEPKYLGGVRVDAVNDATVKVEYEKRSRDIDSKKFLVMNLRWRAQDALVAALTSRAPGVVLEPGTSYRPDIAKTP